MQRPTTSLLKRLTQGYKASRFPWKKHVLVGIDLDGNEYWEMPNPLGGREKRWVEMREEPDYANFRQDQIPVQWQSWLRHTRFEAPTIQDLIADERRKALIQERAHRLDIEWQQRKLELAQQKVQQEMPQLAEVKDDDEGKQPKTSQPKGQGDSFQPGEWSPSSSRR
ncbi:hypothetical protein EC973_003573 [Apophysomyces ossiformis]|uniref:NADH dehydrogenase [ubiquinone] 1 alpha subcomplex subunit n=1 Tax=Apophysomyces ossiformis TaxID=679940 RepID=A0A8H7BZX0_9FUNG|nr:hypothetical protein EC973_003573 [Apophysomyces ossiformis]